MNPAYSSESIGARRGSDRRRFTKQHRCCRQAYLPVLLLAQRQGVVQSVQPMKGAAEELCQPIVLGLLCLLVLVEPARR